MDPVESSDPPPPPRRRKSSRWLWAIALVLPVVVAVLTQLEAAQFVDGYLIEGMPWDVGKLDVIADIIAPLWALSFIVIAALNRRLLDRFEPDPSFAPTSRLGRTLGTSAWVRRSTWVVTGGSVLLILLAYTREWERFGEQPGMGWYVVVLLATIALSALPLWWVRLDVERSLREPLQRSGAMAAIDQYLFTAGSAGRVRWSQLVALAGVTAIAAWLALGQLDALLHGMHLTNQASYGVGSLTAVFQLDLSQKPGQVAEVVSTWSSYSAALGPQFASARSVLGQYLLIDTLVLIPSYTALIGVMLLRARKGIPPELTGRTKRSYDLLIATGLSTIAIVAVADLIENVVVWLTVDGVWGGGGLAGWAVRLIWAAAFVRTAGLILLAGGAVVLLALRRQRATGVFQALIAVRGELLVVVLLAFAFTAMPQTADVIRRWTVSVALITTVFATALAVLLQWTSSRTLHGLQRSSDVVAAGETLSPASVSIPGIDNAVSLRKLVIVVLIAAFAIQVLFTMVFDVPLGLRLGIPLALIAVLWLFGVPLPRSSFDRGDRPIADKARSRLPRILGAAVLVILGSTVIKSAIGQLVFARHGDWWLLFTLLPISVGLYRLHTRTAEKMGRAEGLILLGVGAVAVWLIIVAGDPELSPVASTWVGLMILYGALPFYYSFDPASAVSAVTRTRIRWLKVQPVLAVGVTIAGLTALGLVVFPLELAPGVGTISVILLAAMLFAAFAAALVGFAEWTRPPDILAAFRFRRTPVFVLLFVWLVLAGSSYNDVSVIEGGAVGARPGITIDDAFARWEQRNPEAATASALSGEREAVPMVFVASSGGGLRAAAWTGYVMDCVFGDGAASGCRSGRPGSPQSIMAMSGVSGGSLGLASYAGSRVGEAGDDADWVSARLGGDYMAAAMAWLAFVDAPRTFLGFAPRIGDRAAMMERALERSWRTSEGDGFLSGGIFELWHSEPEIPLMIFNGTSVTSPCRFNISVVDSNAHVPGDSCTSLLVFEGSTSELDQSAALAATQDLVDYLCPGQDLRLSTAALLSARFPVISSSGKVGAQLASCGSDPRDAYVVDGGYLEGSGAGTAMELWDHVEARVSAWNADPSRACIVPFFLQIDNGYENPGTSSGGRPREALVPITALVGSQFGRMANAREQAAIEFDQPFVSGGARLVVQRDGAPVGSRYARLVTRAHPGVQAPLGWTLSDASIDDLKSQLLIGENQRELAEVGSWLDGHLTCDIEVQS